MILNILLIASSIISAYIKDKEVLINPAYHRDLTIARNGRSILAVPQNTLMNKDLVNVLPPQMVQGWIDNSILINLSGHLLCMDMNGETVNTCFNQNDAGVFMRQDRNGYYMIKSITQNYCMALGKPTDKNRFSVIKEACDDKKDNQKWILTPVTSEGHENIKILKPAK